MKKLLLLLSCIFGIGSAAPTPVQAWDGYRAPVVVYRGSYGYPAYRPYYHGYGAYPVRYRHYGYGYYNDNCGYQPLYYGCRPRFGFSFFFGP